MNREKINKYKQQLLQQQTYDDMIKFYDNITLNENDHNIIILLKSFINQDNYIKKMDIDKFCLYLDIIDGIYFRDDANQIIIDIKNQTDDIAQLHTLNRIIRNKPCKYMNDSINTLLTKNCPHCGKKAVFVKDTQYVVCGYTHRGFDWKGCARDWCFQCGKKLCKSWNVDMLYNISNRMHDSKCCKHCSAKLGLNYEKDFCQCNNNYVKRLQ